MFKAPSKNEVTQKFEADNATLRDALQNLRGEALQAIKKGDLTLMADYNSQAQAYTDKLMAVGAQAGFGFTHLTEKSIY